MTMNICIFCGSSVGTEPGYAAAARTAGQRLAERGMRVVYGGGAVGLMGEVATAAIEAGGEVIGVIPHGLANRERMHAGVSEMHLVDSMHERKATMADLSAGFIALPGGMGTLEELCEVFTWGQLGIHGKPFGILNVEGYFDLFVAFLDHMVERGFLSEKHRSLITIADDIDDLLAAFEAFEPPAQTIWLHRDET